MKAGRELDALVAEKVMEDPCPTVDIYTASVAPWPKGPSHTWGISTLVSTGERSWYYRGPRYSTSIADAWRVVEKMKEDGWRWTICDDPMYGRGVTVERGDDNNPNNYEGVDVGIQAHALDEVNAGLKMTVPEAICLAALRAKGVDL